MKDESPVAFEQLFIFSPSCFTLTGKAA